ncbi:MAG: anti-sigma F factor [Clostridiales bacterium]|nr:anti-sigma F factor [Clostridiales bacterium]
MNNKDDKKVFNQNKMTISVQSKTVNEALVRSSVAAFCAELDPTVDQINEIKTALTEAVNNSIVHGYDGDIKGFVHIEATINGDTVHIRVQDQGKGIADVEAAIKPFYTTKPDQERSGMGFTVMEAFMDNLKVVSNDRGTVVEMSKRIKA